MTSPIGYAGALDVLPGVYPPIVLGGASEGVVSEGAVTEGADTGARLAVENEAAAMAGGSNPDCGVVVAVDAVGGVIAATAGESVGNVNPPVLAGGGVV